MGEPSSSDPRNDPSPSSSPLGGGSPNGVPPTVDGAPLPASPVPPFDQATEAATPIPDSAEARTSAPPSNSERLQLAEEIARGGMGAILKGHDLSLGRDIAVKVLLEAHAGRAEFATRFVEEARIAGQLQHPGVAPVYELGVLADERPYFTMKLVKGQTLAALLAARKTPDEERSRFLGIFAQVCQTLAYAHARGVIHRDLKPSNIMVGAFGEVQVMDWGLAKVLPKDGAEASPERPRAENVSVIRTVRGTDTPESGSYTQAGTMLGTLAYMAPEQARGDVDLVDERADVFGLGAMLCEILTGKPPYIGEGAEIAYKARTAKLEDAFGRLEACGADAELVALTRHCLAAELWERPRDAGVVAMEVTDYQNSVAERLRQAELARAAEEARAMEARATAAQERRARRMTLSLVATVLLVVLLGGGGWLWLHNQRAARLAENNRLVGEALNQATAFHEQARTAQGRTALALEARGREEVRRAEALIEREPADPALTTQVRQLLTELDADEKDRQLLAALDAARLAQTVTSAKKNRFPTMRADLLRRGQLGGYDFSGYGYELQRAVPLYRKAFHTYGMLVGEEEPAAVAARLRGRPTEVREAVVSALDEWIALAGNPRWMIDEPHLTWLRALLAAAEPEGWGKQVRDAAAEKDPEKRRAMLEKLAATADVKRLSAHALTRLADRLWDERALKSAVALLKRVRVDHPNDCWINENLGKWLGSEEYLMAAVALRPDSADAHINLALWARDPDKAIPEYRKAIELDPTYALPHYLLGIALLKEGDSDEAIAECHKAIELEPTDPAAYCALGLVLEKNHSKKESVIAMWHAVINLNPNAVWPHSYLGDTLLTQNKLEEAVTEYRKAIQINPTIAPLHSNLGDALRSLDKLEEAIAEYRKAIELDPKYDQPHYDLAEILKDQGNLDEAIIEYRKILKLNPENAYVFLASVIFFIPWGN